MTTLREMFDAVFAFAESNAAPIFLVSLSVPIVGIALAWIGRGGRSEEDGKAFANAFVYVAVLQFVLAIIGGYVGVAFLDRNVWDTNVFLLMAPWAWLGLSVAGLRIVFPLSELTSWRSILDVGGFFAACAVFVWLMSMFRGWGILFIGGLVELLVILGLAGLLLRVLFMRAFRKEGHWVH